MKKYRYNTRTHEMHEISRITLRCNAGTKETKPMGSHWKECGGFKAWILRKVFRYDGCHWCLDKWDK